MGCGGVGWGGRKVRVFKAEAGCGGGGMGSWGWCECLVFVDCLFPQNGGPRWIFAVFLVRTNSYILKFTVFACLRHGKCISFNVLKRFENCVNTGVFARRWPKNIVYKILQILNTCAAIFDTRGTKHYKYHGFVLPRRQKHWYFKVFETSAAVSGLPPRLRSRRRLQRADFHGCGSSVRNA